MYSCCLLQYFLLLVKRVFLTDVISYGKLIKDNRIWFVEKVEAPASHLIGAYAVSR